MPEMGVKTTNFNTTSTLDEVIGNRNGSTVRQSIDSLAIQIAVKASFTRKEAVASATTANIALSGEQTIDGVTTSASRVLVKSQSTAAQNGIYVTAAGAWSRASDMDAAGEVQGAAVYVAGGTANAGKTFYTGSAVTTLGTDAITWVVSEDQTALQGEIADTNVRVSVLEKSGLAAESLGWSEAVVGALPSGAIADINMLSIFGEDGRKADGRGVVSSRNMITECTGSIIGAVTSGTVTERHANGPQGSQTAKRLNLSSGGIYDLFKDRTFPAGQTRVTLKAKLNATGATADIEFGIFGGATEGTQENITLNTSTWVTLTTLITTNGAQSPRCAIKATYGAIDILIDEVQLYLASEATPAFADETVGAAALKNDVGYVGSLTFSNMSLDNTGGGLEGRLPLPAFPADTSLSAVTIFAVCKNNNVDQLVAKALDFSGGGGTLGFGTSYGILYGAPALPYTDRNPGDRVDNLDYQVYAIRVQAGEQSLWVDKFPHTAKTVASPTIPSVPLLMVGDDEDAISHPYEGNYTNLLMYGRALSDAEMISAANVLRARHQLTGLAGCDIADVWITEGDSIAHEDRASPDGPSYQAQYFASPRAGIVGKNNAIPGSQLSHLESRKANLVDRIQKASAGGLNPIVSVMVGTNGLPTIAALESYWGDLQAAGAKVLAITIPPRDDGTINNTDRKSLNTSILASGVPDAVADIAGDPDIGADGAPTAGTYYYDLVHLNGAGHAIALSIIEPLIESLRL